MRAHLHGGVPISEIDALDHFWKNYSGLRERVFVPRLSSSLSPWERGGVRESDGVRAEDPASGKHPKTLMPPELLRLARNLRHNSTNAEQLIWQFVRDRQIAGAKFRRQHPLDPYVLDFYCHELKLAVELDGGRHNEPTGRAHDARRDEFLAAQGIRTLRFWNNQVLAETEAVLEAVYRAVTEMQTEKPSPSPLPAGEGGAGSGPLPLGEGKSEGHYADFAPAVTDRRAIAELVKTDPGVAKAHARFLEKLDLWWKEHLPSIESLAPTNGQKGNVYELRRSLLASIAKAFAGQSLLNEHQVRGALASYFEFFKPEFKSIAFSGWGPELIPDDEILQSQFPEILAGMEQKRLRLAELSALFAAANEEDYDDSDDIGVLPDSEVKTLKAELKEVKSQAKLAKKETRDQAGFLARAEAAEKRLARHKALEDEAKQ